MNYKIFKSTDTKVTAANTKPTSNKELIYGQDRPFYSDHICL